MLLTMQLAVPVGPHEVVAPDCEVKVPDRLPISGLGVCGSPVDAKVLSVEQLGYGQVRVTIEVPDRLLPAHLPSAQDIGVCMGSRPQIT